MVVVVAAMGASASSSGSSIVSRAATDACVADDLIDAPESKTSVCGRGPGCL